jgi:hypothetical protein
MLEVPLSELRSQSRLRPSSLIKHLNDQFRVAQGEAMPRTRAPSLRRLPDGSLLQNRLLAALPAPEYDRILNT